MRALVTGATGFVGRHLVELLRGNAIEIFALGGPHDDESHFSVDLIDGSAVRALVQEAEPDLVYHLAAQAFVPTAIERPHETYETNIIGTANLLTAVRDWQHVSGKKVRIVYVSSAEVYGSQPLAAMPIKETTPANPANPYAASKAAAEAVVLGEVNSFGLDALITRAFNHIGPGQSTRFAVASFAAQLAEIQLGGKPCILVGNLDARRDYSDVRDVVAAYVALATNGTTGEIYNICSDASVSMKQILAQLIRISGVAVEVREDKERLRPADAPILFGTSAKLRSAIGWEPKISLQQSLRDVYDDALTRLEKAALR